MDAIALFTAYKTGPGSHLLKTDGGVRSRITDEAYSRGISIEWVRVPLPALGNGYKELFRSKRNVITLGYKTDFSWTVEKKQNVLYLENSILSQKSGLFCDSGGLFSDSNLSRESFEYDVVDVGYPINDWYGWTVGAGGNPTGPVLVCLQLPRDRSVSLPYFPLGKRGDDQRTRLLELIFRHFDKSYPVVVRKHPKDYLPLNMEYWRSHWIMDSETRFEDVLPKCRGVITVSSTCATEAAILGVPTATFGVGYFTNNNITLDCSSNPALLNTLLEWKPKVEDCIKYAQKILSRNFLSYQDPYAYSCYELYRWIDRCV